MNGLDGHALIAQDRQLAAMWLNVLALVLNVGLNVALVPSQGIDAAAWTALGCELVLLAGSSWMVWRWLGYAPSFVALARALPAAAAMAAAVWPMRDEPLWLTVPAGALVYVAVLVLLGGSTAGGSPSSGSRRARAGCRARRARPMAPSRAAATSPRRRRTTTSPRCRPRRGARW